MTKIVLKTPGAGESVEVAMTRLDSDRPEIYTVDIDGRTLGAEIERLEPGSGWLRLNSQILPFHAVRRGDVMLVWVHGRTYRFDLVKQTARRATDQAAAAAGGDLTAPMPGTVLKIQVVDGEEFAAHQPLIIMESMKMEMTLSSPRPGRVREVRCAKGQLVEMGAVLVTLEPIDDKPAAD
jgi:biotin carboxyl carrier protein